MVLLVTTRDAALQFYINLARDHFVDARVPYQAILENLRQHKFRLAITQCCWTVLTCFWLRERERERERESEREREREEEEEEENGSKRIEEVRDVEQRVKRNRKMEEACLYCMERFISANWSLLENLGQTLYIRMDRYIPPTVCRRVVREKFRCM